MLGSQLCSRRPHSATGTGLQARQCYRLWRSGSREGGPLAWPTNASHHAHSLRHCSIRGDSRTAPSEVTATHPATAHVISCPCPCSTSQHVHTAATTTTTCRVLRRAFAGPHNRAGVYLEITPTRYPPSQRAGPCTLITTAIANCHAVILHPHSCPRPSTLGHPLLRAPQTLLLPSANAVCCCLLLLPSLLPLLPSTLLLSSPTADFCLHPTRSSLPMYTAPRPPAATAATPAPATATPLLHPCYCRSPASPVPGTGT